jgi:hypothetical protein
MPARGMPMKWVITGKNIYTLKTAIRNEYLTTIYFPKLIR